MLIPVILSGGSGTRLWPLSRELYPKQLLPLAGELTMLQETVRRLDGIDGPGEPLPLAPPLVICNEEHRFLVAEQLRRIGVEQATILLEPVGRNTAPAVTLAALSAEAEDILLVMPADHVIKDQLALQAAIRQGLAPAKAGRLVTFGIVPAAAETGYGYIKKGEAAGDAFAIEQFVEKPDAATARRYLASGEYLWNSGMFLFSARTWLARLEEQAPEMLAACRRAWAAGSRDHDFFRVGKEDFAACPADSIDYAVMEKAGEQAVVIPLAAGWSDVGSWSALWEVQPHDEQGNACQGDVMLYQSANSYFYAQERLLVGIGVENLVVVETADTVLVAHKDRVQEVKQIVGELKARNRCEHLTHRRVYRPWGSYEGIDRGERYQVKRITVNPGASLSLQMHHHRAEHWVVVRGTARITRGEEVMLVGENQSTYIPLGTPHRLENPGNIPVEMIEVQSGSYLGEDDIVRFEDNYGRL
ncbi:mannose-1-phosphate guanylyltransferase/mannose-6-phosphate isomerase [Desulfurivibrio alkaliphilus]|uniref:mannose-1-phosphate guanylyltransferase n=1 Tax=Desulfurivibrio alkaliphilus (strain DSM 19089 / UNIQEM U267 / AHT2) TaxID=589865 RepID=D6Z3I2_DESAT|nr:mannose-1-phosphate guanylyltransferase/mannose-6-phosphate isomerase [Desulfurivibrio alkaliphilus]ADH86107.1 mannose-1-phosphate guanylyltransferase/mannose-6-phosphate isomerase [Desulfurivibrio alkaliphilus AHT 2]